MGELIVYYVPSYFLDYNFTSYQSSKTNFNAHAGFHQIRIYLNSVKIHKKA